MASIADQPRAAASSDDRFFFRAALLMAFVVVLGFSTHLAMGRSSFGAPPLVHAHAIVFMGWVTIYVLQNALATHGRVDLHRKLGWFAALWMVAMVILGIAATIAMVRRGGVPFFFEPLHFLVFNPLTVLTFAGLTTAAIVMRRRTDWHRRLHFCGMSLLLGPAFGRLLPGPLLIPFAYEAVFAATLLFPIAGVIADLRRSGRVHPAWVWGIGTMLASLLLITAITHSALGTAYYRAVTAGSPGAAIAPLDYPASTGGPR